MICVKGACELEKKYKEEGMGIGADNALVEAIKNIMNDTNQSYEETCASMGI